MLEIFAPALVEELEEVVDVEDADIVDQERNRAEPCGVVGQDVRPVGGGAIASLIDIVGDFAVALSVAAPVPTLPTFTRAAAARAGRP